MTGDLEYLNRQAAFVRLAVLIWGIRQKKHLSLTAFMLIIETIRLLVYNKTSLFMGRELGGNALSRNAAPITKPLSLGKGDFAISIPKSQVPSHQLLFKGEISWNF